jgi:hypothetical protein
MPSMRQQEQTPSPTEAGDTPSLESLTYTLASPSANALLPRGVEHVYHLKGKDGDPWATLKMRCAHYLCPEEDGSLTAPQLTRVEGSAAAILL